MTQLQQEVKCALAEGASDGGPQFSQQQPELAALSQAS